MCEIPLHMELQKWAIIKRLTKMGSEMWKTELLETKYNCWTGVFKIRQKNADRQQNNKN